MNFASAQSIRAQYFELQNELIKKHSLTLEEFLCLRCLMAQGELGQNELARQVQVSYGGMSRLIPRLRQRGLVSSRETSRQILISITPSGRRKLSSISKAGKKAA